MLLMKAKLSSLPRSSKLVLAIHHIQRLCADGTVLPIPSPRA